MLLRIALLFGSAALFASDDPWVKVRQIKSGSELRILKKGSQQPLLARMDEASEDRIVVVVKNEQTSIAKEEIDRIDYRPLQKGSRVTKETKTSTDSGYSDPVTPSTPHGRGGPSGSSSTSVSIGSKPDFETVYRRPPRGK